MSDPVAFEDLIDRLERFGDSLDFPDSDVSSDVLRRISTRRQSRVQRRWLIAAAVVLSWPEWWCIRILGTLLARWFGFERLVVEVDPDLPVRAPRTGFDAPGPGESRVVVVEGREILVSAVSGTWSDGLLTKSIGASDQIEEVDVDGLRGLWISGAPHEVLYAADNDEVVVDRVSANTLVWQDSDVLYRVEGFANLDDALAFIEDGT